MKFLGIDSSTPLSSVALLKNGKILRQVESDKNSSVSSQFLGLVDKVLSEAKLKLSDLDAICLTVGPGSFTGLRVGTSILKGLVLATSKPFIKIDTLEATALLAMPTSNDICAILDAKKKETYTASFRPNDGCLERLTPDRAITPNQLCEEIKNPTVFVGSGLDSFAPMLASQLGKKFVQEHNKIQVTVAACAAILGEKKFQTDKCFDLKDLYINYIRKSEAELKFAKNGFIKGAP